MTKSLISSVLGVDHVADPLVNPENPLSDGAGSVDAHDSARIIERLRTFGYTVLDAGPRDLAGAEDAALALSRLLQLGQAPYVPALYRGTRLYEPSGLNVISSGGRAAEAGHAAFTATQGQNWHVDGTLEAAGAIRYTVLFMLVQGTEGGATRFFNAFGAFERLCALDVDAARTLTLPGALTRFASFDAGLPGTTGPVFATDGRDRLINRYSRTAGDVYRVDEGGERNLWKALAEMEAMSLAGSPYEASVRLGPGQALIFRNDRLSHGRLPYQEVSGSPRKIARAMYTSEGADDLGR